MSHLEKLFEKYREDELFRRVCIGSPTWTEMVVEAYLKDLAGRDEYALAPHGLAAFDILAADGRHIQVKTLSSIGSIARIVVRPNMPAEIVIVTAFPNESPHFYRVPLDANSFSPDTLVRLGR